MTPRSFAPFLILALVAHALDLVTTIVGVIDGVPEGNPVMTQLLNHYGLVGMDLVKIALVGALGILLWRVRLRYPRSLWLVAVGVLALPALAVVVLNILAIGGLG